MFPMLCSFAKSVPMAKFRFKRGAFRRWWSSYLFVALICVVTTTSKSLSWTAPLQRPFCGQTAEPCPLHPGDVPLGRESNIPVHEKQHDTVAPVMNRQAALEVLGFRAGANPSKTELKHAFKKEVLRVHPDRPGGDGERLLQIKAAYEILVSPSRAAAPKYGRKGPTSGWREEDFLDLEEEYLTDVWKEIGFNPYTGEVYEPLTGKPYPASHIYQDREKHTYRGQAPAGKQSEKAAKTAVDGVAQSADLSQAIFPGLLVAFALAVSVSSQVEDPRGSGPVASQPTAPVAMKSIPTPPPAPAPVSVVSDEIAWDAEYVLALATAKEQGVPVVAGAVPMTPEIFWKWLALPEQDHLKNIFAPVHPEAELDETTLATQERCWRSFGSTERFNYMVNTLTSLLHENDGPKPRYRSVMAVVGQRSLVDIATSLQVFEKLEFAEFPASGETEMHGTRRLFQDQVSGRELIRMMQPSTGQEVVLIGTSHIPQKYQEGHHISNPLGRAMPGLRALIGYLEDPVLVMDKTTTELEEFAADVKPLTGVVGSPEIRESSDLEHFIKPPWDAVQ